MTVVFHVKNWEYFIVLKKDRVEKKVFGKDEKYTEFRIDYNFSKIKLDSNT